MLVKELKNEPAKSLRGELDGGRSPASNQINSRQSLVLHGFGERSDFFANIRFRKKTGVLRLSKCFFDSLKRRSRMAPPLV